MTVAFSDETAIVNTYSSVIIRFYHIVFDLPMPIIHDGDIVVLLANNPALSTRIVLAAFAAVYRVCYDVLTPIFHHDWPRGDSAYVAVQLAADHVALVVALAADAHIPHASDDDAHDAQDG